MLFGDTLNSAFLLIWLVICVFESVCDFAARFKRLSKCIGSTGLFLNSTIRKIHFLRVQIALLCHLGMFRCASKKQALPWQV